MPTYRFYNKKTKEEYTNFLKLVCNEIIENKLHPIKETFLKQ